LLQRIRDPLESPLMLGPSQCRSWHQAEADLSAHHITLALGDLEVLPGPRVRFGDRQITAFRGPWVASTESGPIRAPVLSGQCERGRVHLACQ